MPKPKGITKRQRKAIRNYVKQGYSANRIQRRLRARHMGIRRTVLLAEVRKVKRQKPKANLLKYTPKKYRKMVSGIPHPPTIRQIGGRQVAVYGFARTERVKRVYSSRFEFYGSGKDLYRAIKLMIDRKLVPRKEWAFVKVNARDFLNDPDMYGEEGDWTGKPEIRS